MNQIVPNHRLEIPKWVAINALIGFTIPMFYSFESYFSLEGYAKIWDEILFSFMMSMGISASVGLNERILDRHFPWLDHAGKRLVFEFLGVTVFGYSAAFIMNVFFYSILGRINWSNFPWEYLARNSVGPLIIGYFITAFFVSRGFLFKAKEEAVRSEKLQTEKYRSEVRVLKDQLNPHFLFNALNVLTNMVYEDADQSADYIRKLGRFYRYVLEVQEEDLVPLDSELKFCLDYLKLQQERFGAEALSFQINLESSEHWQVPPLALQLLLENALKHNRCSEAEPLQIVVDQNGPQLSICNSLQERSNHGETLGIGLSNLMKRYELMGAESPEILKEQNQFCVKIPLIPAS